MRKNVFRWLIVMLMVSLLSPIYAMAAGIVVDHRHVDIVIPDYWVQQAKQVRSVLRHASVGGNIRDALENLQRIDNKFDLTNMIFSGRSNPDWEAKIADLNNFSASNLNNYDVFAQKFCFIDQNANWVIYRDSMVNLENNYASKKFVWWTMPIMSSDQYDNNASLRNNFNNSVRQYFQNASNNKVLFDVADIESHKQNGSQCLDGIGREIMCMEYAKLAYTGDTGHLNLTGATRVAKAYWYLMARLAGWDGNTGTSPIPTSGTCQVSTGDTNGNGVDIQDGYVWYQAYKSGYVRAADFNCDGNTNVQDGYIWYTNFR